MIKMNEIKKLYYFFGLNETNREEANAFNNDWDSLEDFEGKIWDILDKNEKGLVQDGKPFILLSIMGLYEGYCYGGTLDYLSTDKMKMYYEDWGSEYIKNKCLSYQQAYDNFEIVIKPFEEMELGLKKLMDKGIVENRFLYNKKLKTRFIMTKIGANTSMLQSNSIEKRIIYELEKRDLFFEVDTNAHIIYIYEDNPLDVFGGD